MGFTYHNNKGMFTELTSIKILIKHQVDGYGGQDSAEETKTADEAKAFVPLAHFTPFVSIVSYRL